jgi:hypothetical protein
MLSGRHRASSAGDDGERRPYLLLEVSSEQIQVDGREGFDDKARFDMAVRQIAGKRLTWNQLNRETD